jgi:small GTP-binding protein
LVSNLIQIYSGLSPISPLLAKLVLGLLIGLLVFLIAALVYYAALFLRPRRRYRQLVSKAPANKVEAAEETLKAVRHQVEQIQDEVARQALFSRAHEIEEIRSQGALRIVVFGTGSAGKTSLINAIIGRIVGEVGAPMGTTIAEKNYSLHLRGLEREIQIVDTPGILEAGVAGTEREQLARRLATEANLLLFVVDNDLRKSEYEPLRALAEIGKRSILVFNKIDLYTEANRQAILARLQEHVQPFIAPDDVVPVAACPGSIVLENGDRIQLEPDILPLLHRIAVILRSEGEELVADNILLQSQRLGEETRQLLDAQRCQQAEKIVERFQWIGAGVVSLTPLPVMDLLATAAVNAQMVVEIGHVYDCEINLDRGKELAISLAKTLVSLGVVRGAVELLSLALQTNVSTFVIGRAIQGATAAYLTRIAGKSFIEYFRCDQDWGDGGMTEIIQKQFQLNRREEFIKVFVQDAIARLRGMEK